MATTNLSEAYLKAEKCLEPLFEEGYPPTYDAIVHLFPHLDTLHLKPQEQLQLAKKLVDRHIEKLEPQTCDHYDRKITELETLISRNGSGAN